MKEDDTMSKLTANMDRKYGIKTISLANYFPTFLKDYKNGLVKWEEANEDIYGRISTFLVMIAHIKATSYKCYCCIYPHNTSAEYTVFVDIDSGRLCLLLTTIRDSNFYTKDGRRIQMLKDGFLLLDAPQDALFTLRQGIPGLRHPAG